MKIFLPLFVSLPLIFLASCANQKNIQTDATNSEETIQQLTHKKIKQEKNETGEFLLIQEETDLTSAYFNYWVLDLQTNKILNKGSITKGEVAWYDTYAIKIIRYPEVIKLNELSTKKEEIIYIKEIKQ